MISFEKKRMQPDKKSFEIRSRKMKLGSFESPEEAYLMYLTNPFQNSPSKIFDLGGDE